MSSLLDSAAKLAWNHAARQQRKYSVLLSAIGLGYGCSWINQYLSADALNHGTTADFDWDNEIVLVTGGAGGIGGEIVQQMARRPTKVVVLDVMDLTYTPSKVATALTSHSAESLTRPAPNVYYYKCDITNHNALKAVADEIRR